MKLFNAGKTFATFAAACLLAAAAPTHAAIIISEVDAAGSNAANNYNADWFELTNTGSTTVNISGWKMDDNSNLFANAVALTGVSSIAAGQSVIFIEGDLTTVANFKAAWFGANVPAEFTMGYYNGTGAGVGLSQTADAVNIFDNTGSLVTRVAFGATTLGRTLENKAGLNNATLSTLSTVGVNGAFTSYNGTEIGSPGVVPLPGALPLFLSAFGIIGGVTRARRSQKN